MSATGPVIQLLGAGSAQPSMYTPPALAATTAYYEPQLIELEVPFRTPIVLAVTADSLF